METTIICWGYTGITEDEMDTTGVKGKGFWYIITL